MRELPQLVTDGHYPHRRLVERGVGEVTLQGQTLQAEANFLMPQDQHFGLARQPCDGSATMGQMHARALQQAGQAQEPTLIRSKLELVDEGDMMEEEIRQVVRLT